MNPVESQSASPIIEHCCYATAFVDLLGQKANFKNIDKMPDAKWTDYEVKEFNTGIQKTYGAVVEITEQIQSAVAILDANDYRTRKAEDVPKQLKKEHWPKLKTISFSDGILLYYPLGSSEIPGIGAHHMLSIAGLVMLGSLANRIPLRIGIELGHGAEIGNILYGPAIANAYELEEHVAEWPRAIVGKQMQSYLYEITSRSDENQSDAHKGNQRMAQLSLEIIGKDNKGHWFVDYLSPFFLKSTSLIQSNGERSATIDQAYLFICSEYQQFLKMGDVKLCGRYALLKNYFDAFFKRERIAPPTISE